EAAGTDAGQRPSSVAGTGLTRRAPRGHVVHVVIETAPRRTAPSHGVIGPPPAFQAQGTNPSHVLLVAQMRDEVRRIALAVAVAIAHLPADFGIALAEPLKLHWRKSPVGPHMRWRMRDVVRRGRVHVACAANSASRCRPG